MTARSIPLSGEPPRRKTATCCKCGGPTERSAEMQGIAKCAACCAAYRPSIPPTGPIRQPIQRTEEVQAGSPIRVERTFLTPEAARAVGAPAPAPPPEEPPMPAPAANAPASECPFHPGSPARGGGVCHICGQILRTLAKARGIPKANTASLEILRFVRMEEITRWNCYRRLKAMRDALDAGAEPGTRVPVSTDPKARKAAPQKQALSTPPSALDGKTLDLAASLISSARTLNSGATWCASSMAKAALADAGLEELEPSVEEGLLKDLGESIAKTMRSAADQAVVRARMALS